MRPLRKEESQGESRTWQCTTGNKKDQIIQGSREKGGRSQIDWTSGDDGKGEHLTKRQNIRTPKKGKTDQEGDYYFFKGEGTSQRQKGEVKHYYKTLGGKGVGCQKRKRRE